MISDKKRPDICIYSSGHCGNWNRVIWFSQNVLKFIERFHNKQKQNIPYVSYKKLPNEAFFNDFWNTFFKFSFSWENCFLKKLKIENTKNKNFDVALKKHVLMKARYYSKLVLNKCLNTNSDLGRGEYSKHWLAIALHLLEKQSKDSLTILIQLMRQIIKHSGEQSNLFSRFHKVTA